MDEHKLLEQIGMMFEDYSEKLANRIKGEFHVIIETEVTRRIDSLFDGYKLAHEKQWELERKMEALERRIEELENRTA